MPAGIQAGNTFLRLRLSSSAAGAAQPTGSAPTGQTWNGEVEDHRVTIVTGSGTISGWKFNDRNADGVWNNLGMSIFIPPVEITGFGTGQQVLMSGKDSNNQDYTDVVGNDDLSSAIQDFGFDFEFYGQTYSQFYINNNGNITFEGPLGRFLPAGFPDGTPILAPFWADVDTRTGAGNVRLTKGTTGQGSPFVQVDWVDVGYFDQTKSTNTDARNAFSLYIEDSPLGDIVVFDYQSMEWTTGDGTGTAGFGGQGAQIGFNAGDGTYLSLMRPKSGEDLSDLLQIEQYAFRIDPASGAPVIPEPGMGGVEVFLDLDGDGAWTPADLSSNRPEEPHTTTWFDDLSTPDVDETGYYEFTGLFPREEAYIVREIVPSSDWVQTSPNTTAHLPEGKWTVQVEWSTSDDIDGETFTIDDGTGEITFEFDDDGSVVQTPTRRAVVISPSHRTAADLAATVAHAINQTPGLDVAASAAGDLIALSAEGDASLDVGLASATALSDKSSQSDEDGFYSVYLLNPGDRFERADFGNFRIPHISVSDVEVYEGQTGETTAEVTVHVKKSFGSAIDLVYSTENGDDINPDLNATDGDNDYDPVAAGHLPIGPQQDPLGEWTSSVLGPVYVREERTDEIEINLVTPGALAMAPNDDQSTGLLDLGFVFEFYGNNFTQFYINNNGNITFERALWEYVPEGFPYQTPIVAPFWADVDTRPDGTTGAPGGEVRWTQGTTSEGHAFVQVDWIDVGYFFAHTDLRNTFTLYIEDDPAGDIVAFVYHDMRWATSDTDPSGLGAQIGFDSGDGANYLSLMRPNNQAGLNALNAMGQWVFRIDPATGEISDDVAIGAAEYFYDASGDYVVWEAMDGSDREIYLHNVADGTTRRLTNNSRDDYSPSIHGSYVTWVGRDGYLGTDGTGNDSQIYLYDIQTGQTRQLTNTLYAVGNPQVSDGYVTWWASTESDRDVYLYDIATRATQNLSDEVPDHAGLDDVAPVISGSLVAWYGYDGKDYEVYVYDAAQDVLIQASDNVGRDEAVQIEGNNVVWMSYDGNDYEIWHFEYDAATQSGTAIPITDNLTDDFAPQVAGENIVWQGYDGVDPDNPADRGDWDIFRYHIPSGAKTNVSANASHDDWNPQIVQILVDGEPHYAVAWESERLGGNWEVMHRLLDPGAAAQNVSRDSLTEGGLPMLDRLPRVTGSLMAWRAFDGESYQLMIATQEDPELTFTLPVTVNGDTKPELDESFYVNVDGAVVAGPNGSTIDAEVDDSQAVVTILNDDAGMDFGDAPAGYATLLAEDGARHAIPTGAGGSLAPPLYLGAGVDPESDGQPNSAATGDDDDLLGDDEDGVEIAGRLAPDHIATFNVTIHGQGYLTGWIDYNRDGVFQGSEDVNGNGILEPGEDLDGDGVLDTNEQIINTTAGTPIGTAGATETIPFQVFVPETVAPGFTYARFRFSTDRDAVMIGTGEAPDGEVEDYRVQIEVGDASISGHKFYDLNNNGEWDLEPLSVDVLVDTQQPGQPVPDLGPTDNGSSSVQNFGFNFEFFGRAYSQFYVNNNGTISFTSPVSSPYPGFPLGVPMLAPFWADVDTSTGAGSVNLVRGTSSRGNPYVQIDWVNVGYYQQHSDKRDKFKVYIEDDPGGDIVVFEYDNMAWTTGDREGVNGFGTLPWNHGALVGFNAGDGQNFVIETEPYNQQGLDALVAQGRYSYRFNPVTGMPSGQEPTLRGVLVYIDEPIDDAVYTQGQFDWKDTNGNLKFDPGVDIAYERFDITDRNGYYEFDRMFPGTYVVREELPAGDWQQTYPNAATVVPLGITVDNGGYVIDLGTTDHITEIDFGNHHGTSEIRVDDVSVVEGQLGVTELEVTLRLAGAFGVPITINLQTSDGSATVADNDYDPINLGDPDSTITFLPQVTRPGEWNAEAITANLGPDFDYEASGNYVVWEAFDGNDWEIYLYDHGSETSTRLTDNATDDRFPAVSGSHVVWSGIPAAGEKYEVYLYDIQAGGPAVRLTDNSVTPVDDLDPQISDTHVVWSAGAGNFTDIWMYQISTGSRTKLTPNNTFRDEKPLIAGTKVVWSSFDGSDNEIWIYDGTTRRLTDNTREDRNVRISEDAVVWEASDGNDYEIFVYEFGALTPRQLTNNNVDDRYPAISGDDVVWQASDGSDSEIWYYNLTVGGQPFNLSNNFVTDERPSIRDGRVAWHSYVGNNWEIFYTDIDTNAIPLNISSNSQYDWYPQVADDFVAWRSYQGGNYEIVIATQSEPEVTQSVKVYVYGDGKVEGDERYSLKLTSPSGAIFSDGTGTPKAELEVGITILNDDGAMDFGDAPLPYPTVLTSNGARHVTGGAYAGYYLGSGVDTESNGRPSFAADGDDTYISDDEDGITFLNGLQPETLANLDIIVSRDGYLNAWFDFNADGAWADYTDAQGNLVHEHFRWHMLESGQRTVPVPADAEVGTTYARFRFSAVEDVSYTGTVLTGEVEDYRISVYYPPTVQLANAVTTLPENASTANRRKVADIQVVQDPLGTSTLSLTGDDAGMFEIDGKVLYLKRNVTLDYENPATRQLDVTVVVDDPKIGVTGDSQASLTITLTDVNEAPAVTLENKMTTLPENANTSAPIPVADIVVTDDALGSEVLSLSGLDAAMFEIVGDVLYLKAGATLDVETNPRLDVTVAVDDPTIGIGVDATAALSITITDANDAPRIDLQNKTELLAENASTTTRTKVADIVVTDDLLGSNTLSLDGTDAGMFEIDGSVLYLRAGVSLDFETKSQLDVTVRVDDPSLGTSFEDSELLSIAVTDVNEAPVITSDGGGDTANKVVAENTTVVTTVAATDEDQPAQTLTYTVVGGADAAKFTIGSATGVLAFAAAPDYEAPTDADGNNVYEVTVEVSDGNGGTDTQAISVAVTDINEAPTVALENTTTSLAENVDTATRIKVGDIEVTDDALGTETLTLTGPDADLFEIDGNALYLKAGAVLDFESNPLLEVTIAVDDSTVGATPDDTDTLAIQVTDAGGSVPGSLVLVGTENADELTITKGVNPGEWIVSLNGTPYPVAGENVEVSFDGLGGSDTVKFIGSDGADNATIRPDQAEFTGPGYSMSLTNIEATDYDGAGGQDTATIWGSRGENEYHAHPGRSEMAGDGVSIVAAAETIYALGYGGGDTVWFHDSPGDDVLEYFPIWARMSGEGYFNHVRGFTTMRADAELGGNDKVVVRGSGLNDYLRVNPYNDVQDTSVVRFLSGTGSIWHIAFGFDEIVGYGRGGGLIDQLFINDTPGADTFQLERLHASLNAPDYGVTVTTHGFGTVEARRAFQNESADSVSLYDAPRLDHDDTLVGNPEQATMTGPGYSNSVFDFPLVMAHSNGKGNDTAYFSDFVSEDDPLDQDDTFTAGPVISHLSGPGYKLWARLFDEVHAEAGQGHDIATLKGSSTADQLNATASEVSLSGTNAEGTFTNYARHFAEVFAEGADGSDKATILDATVDESYGQPAGIIIDQLAQALWMKSFEKIERKTSDGGQSDIEGVDEVFAYWDEP